MNKKPKVFFIGGFLGAGKTSAIRSLARLFASRGLKAAAITNDQAVGLVDTLFLSGTGIAAEEVAGSCFCCNFNGLAQALKQAVAGAEPDVILAEPVGSCTDIVATVIRPMRSLMKDEVEVCAYSVLVEPDRWTELSAPDAPWSMKFLFDKQLEEADFTVITKLDTLTPDRGKNMLDNVSKMYAGATVVGISSLTGTGMQEWLDLVQTTPPGEHWLKEIDYLKYAEAEAEMGWLNGSVELIMPEPSDGKFISARFSEILAKSISERSGKIGHLKLLTVADTGSVKAGITVAGEQPVLDGTFTGPTSLFKVTVNVRATLSPGDLSLILNEAVADFREKDGARTDISAINTFRPGAPNPTYRFGNERNV